MVCRRLRARFAGRSGFWSSVCVALLLAAGMAATGCETGSTHENKAESGLSGQNVGQSRDKSGPVPGSETGTEATSYQLPEAPPSQSAAASTAPTSNATSSGAMTSSSATKSTAVPAAK